MYLLHAHFDRKATKKCQKQKKKNYNNRKIPKNFQFEMAKNVYYALRNRNATVFEMIKWEGRKGTSEHVALEAIAEKINRFWLAWTISNDNFLLLFRLHSIKCERIKDMIAYECKRETDTTHEKEQRRRRKKKRNQSQTKCQCIFVRVTQCI